MLNKTVTELPEDRVSLPSTPRKETTQQQVARLVAIPFPDLQVDRYDELVVLIDWIAARANYWNRIAVRLREWSEVTVDESKRIQKLADGLAEAAVCLQKLKLDSASN